jgi:hypothetical protein
MFLPVRSALRIAVLAFVLAAAATTATLADAKTHPPSAAQIRAAVRHAEHSRALWATVNVCNTKRFPNVLGIRGEMGSMGFAAVESMNVQVDFQASAGKPFRPIAGVHREIGLGRVTTGLHQGGVNFQFGPHAGSLSATVTFEWKLAGKVLARATRRATARHPQAAFGNPAHFSAAQCTIA